MSSSHQALQPLHPLPKWLRWTESGTVIAIKITPGGKRTELVGVTEAELKVKIAAPPINGAANDALMIFVAELLDVRVRDVEILKGLKSKHKSVLVKTLSRAACEELVGRCAASSSARPSPA